MSCVDKRSVSLRVTHHHRRLTSSCESLMDEADREVSSLTDRAFRSLCVGDEAIYNDTEFTGPSPSPVSCLLKPLADEHANKNSDNALRKNGSNGSNGAVTTAWQHRDMSSLLSAFTSGKNGDSTKIPNGMLGGNSMESWDASALRSIQRELAEFSTDFQQGLVDGSFVNSRKHGGSSENKSTKKSVKGGSAGSSSGKSSKSKHSKSSKLKKLNSRNFFLHSEFSPFQAWKDLNQFPFGQESISDLLPSDTFPRWCDTTLYRHLSAAHTIAPNTHILAPNTHTLSPSTHTLALAHTSEPSQGPHKGQRSERSQKTDTTCRSQHAQRHDMAPKTENVQSTDTVQQAESKQTLEGRKDIESTHTTDTLLRDGGPESTKFVQRGSSAQTAEGLRGAERLQGVEGLRPLEGRSELVSKPVEGSHPTAGRQNTAVPEHGRSSGTKEFSAPWRRNRTRASSTTMGSQLEKGSPAADRPPTCTEPPRRQEVRRMEGQNSAHSTPFNITHLLTPIIPCRQETESLDPAVLPALFSPATLDLQTAATLEPKASPEMKARESYRSIAPSLLFNLKDNRKRVKAMYSPPKFRPADPTNNSKLDGTTSQMGTPVLVAADGSPVIESSNALLLPGNQKHSSPAETCATGAISGGKDAEEVGAQRDQLSVPEGLHPGSSPLNRSSLASRPAYPCLNLYKRASPTGADLSPQPATTEVTMETLDNRVVSEGQSSQPVRKVKETPKKSVKDRVKELQGQNTETQGNTNKSPAKSSKETLSVCATDLQAADDAVDKGADREERKEKARPPEVPPKPFTLPKPENPKPAKQPPPVPARIRYPAKAEKGSPDPRETAQRETNPSEDPILTFSARQNSFIKSQRSYQMEDEEGEEWDELREVALLKQMKAELEARQSGQHADGAKATDSNRTESTRATNALQHTGSSPKSPLSPPRDDIAEPSESSGAKNKPAVTNQEQEAHKQHDLAPPSPDRRARKGILSLRGNTLAKRDMFATMEQTPTPGSKSNRKVNTTFTRYDLATMALEEVIAEREERKRRGQGAPAEIQGGAADTRGHTIHPEQRAETTQGHDPQGRHNLPPTAPTKHSLEGRRAGKGRRSSTDNTHTDKTGQSKTHTDRTGQSKTNTDRTGQGKTHIHKNEQGKVGVQALERVRVKRQDSSEQKDREGDRKEPAGRERAQRSRTPPPVPSRKSKPVMRREEVVMRGEERAGVEGIRIEVERQAGEDCDSRDEREDPVYVDRRKEQRGDDDIKGLRETHDRQQEAHIGGGEGNRQGEVSKMVIKVDEQLMLLKDDKQKNRAEETNQVISQEASSRAKTDIHTKEAHKAENHQQHIIPRAEVQPEPSSKQSIQSQQSSKHSVKSEQSSKQPVQSEASSKQSELAHKPTPKVGESPNYPQVQAAGGASSRSEQGEGQGRDEEAPGLKSPKVKPSKSYMRDFLSLLGLTSDDKDTDEHTSIQSPESPDRDDSIHYPASPDLPPSVVDSMTVDDILKSPVYSPLQSPVYSPLQSPVYSPLQSPVYSPLQSPVYSPLQSPIRSSSSHSDDSQRRPGQDRRRWGVVAAGSADFELKEGAVKEGLDDCTFSNPGSEPDASERLITSPLSDLDKGGWVRSLIEQAQNLTPKNMTPKDLSPVSLTPSQSNTSSPTPIRPVLFKVKDNTFVTSPVTKTVRPVLHKSVQDMLGKPWSPREGMGGSDRGSDRGTERVEETPEPPKEEAEPPKEAPGIPVLVETASSPLPERSVPTTPECAAGPAPPSPRQLPPSPRQPLPSSRQPSRGQMLEVPEQERRGSISSTLSEGRDVSSGLSEGPDEMSVGEGSEEAGLGTAHTDDAEDSKAQSEHSGSVCSGTEGLGQGRKPPPAVLPKTEKALKRAMKLTTRRIQKAEKKSRADRHHRAEDNTEHAQGDHRGETREHQHKNRSKEPPQTEQCNHGSSKGPTESGRKHHSSTKEHKSQRTREKSEQMQDKSEHSGHSGHHGDRKGRGGEKHAHVKHEQKSLSSDGYIICHTDPRCHGNGGDSSEQALEQQQASLRDGPINSNHGDRRSKSLERDQQLPHEGLQHHWEKTHTGSDITAAESSRGLSQHTVFNGLLARQNSSEHAYPPSEHMYPNTEHAYTPSTSSLVAQSFPMTQRKLLQDPDSGQYFVVDMPVQVKTKTFFDPETGSYVQLPVQSGEGAIPQPPSVEVLNPSLVVYRGFVPMPVSSLPQHKPTAKPSVSHPTLSGDMENVDNTAPQWREHSSRSEHPYIEPVYAPKDHTPEEELDSVR
ncbi:hypothetical protein ACEWY4_003545 [Coilia grayii]|uniref:DUF4585 domain-containing protein n=1 Tax=Coilia grayii TaxID=363190 RepID=A0ABD1KRJ3_9TELE